MIRSNGLVKGVCVAAVCGVALVGAGCASDSCGGGGACGDESKAACTAPKGGGPITSVNTMCVMENDDPVNPKVEPVVWNGQKVGFCCKGCLPKWNALTDAQKDAAVAKAVSLSKKS